jgi:hypothetical protein
VFVALCIAKLVCGNGQYLIRIGIEATLDPDYLSNPPFKKEKILFTISE